MCYSFIRSGVCSWLVCFAFLMISSVAIGAETPVETPVAIPTETPAFTPTPTFTPRPTHTPTPTQRERLLRTYLYPAMDIYDEPGLIRQVVFSPEGDYFYSSDDQQRIICWNTETGEVHKIFNFDFPFFREMRLSADGNYLLQAGLDGGEVKIVCWDTRTGEEIFNELTSLQINWIDLLPNGHQVIVALTNGSVLILKPGIETKEKLPLNTQNLYSHLTVSPQGTYCAMVGFLHRTNEFEIMIWDLQKQCVYNSFKTPNQGMIYDIQWQANGRDIWINCFHQYRTSNGVYFDYLTLNLYNTQTGDHLYHSEIDSLPNFIAFSPSRDQVAIGNNKELDIYETFRERHLCNLTHNNLFCSAAFSPDGKYLLTGTSMINSKPAMLQLWDIQDFLIKPIPTFVPLTPTPTFTPTPTPTPNKYSLDGHFIEVKPLVLDCDESRYSLNYGGVYAVDPKTGELVMATLEQLEKGHFYLRIYRYPLPETFTSALPKSSPVFSREVFSQRPIRKILFHPDRRLIVLQGEYMQDLYQIFPDGSMRTDTIRDGVWYLVSETAQIPHTKPGDFLQFKNGLISYDLDNMQAEPKVILNQDKLPQYNEVQDMTEGPDGHLSFLMTGDNIAGFFSRHDSQENNNSVCNGPTKIMYWDDDETLKEFTHFSVRYKDHSVFVPHYIAYSNSEKVFYCCVTYWDSRTLFKVYRVTKHDFEYLFDWKDYLYFYSAISQGSVFVQSDEYNHPWNKTQFSEIISHYPTPTPTPLEPTPAPTEIPGWFVLDGYGGIHSTNPDIPRPVLPYWWGFDIARDLEPDPLGRGWYMLDGYGGIHRSSPDLPLPNNLPYFGFDIARNLEIKLHDGKLEFYLLDGYGVIHSSVSDKPGIDVMWFGADWARDLEPGKTEDSWIIMDKYGTLFMGAYPHIDMIRFDHPYLISPIMRSFVRFDDDTTVMMDGCGGRHTNPFYPAKNLVEGLPYDFYFPWEIIWDLEVLPASK